MRVGSLFTGYGGLDMAVGGDLAWYAETNPAACKVLAAHYPGVPNLGDVSQVHWSQVEPVDVITGGYPCQPFSKAGNRDGANDGRNLWPSFWAALGAIRPRWAVLENVREHLSLGFATVLGDLAELGFDARWGVVRASDAGAPHQRPRLFAVASDARRKRHGSGQDSGILGSLGTGTKVQQGNASASRSQPVSGVISSKYGPALEQWAHVVGRTWPEIVKDGRSNPAFVEWMMGLPAGHVTGHGLSPSAELKMLGNGVVPQQARLALQLLGGVA
jgi:DNA (cytosine-5)-methyltransferase 1